MLCRFGPRILSALLVASLAFTSACNRDPEAAKRKYLERGNAYAKKGKRKEALIMYANALKRDPKYGEAYYRRSLVYLDDGQAIAAIRDLHRTVELQPDNQDANSKLINLYLQLYLSDPKRPKQLVTELRTIHERLMKKNPNSYEALRLSGYLALTENKVKDAITFFQQANRVKPFEADVILVLMQSLLSDGRAQEAEQLGLDLLKKNPEVSAAYDSLYLLYIRQQRDAEAERILQNKVTKLPGSVEARSQLAAHYYARKDRDRMMATLRTITDDPKRFPDGYEVAGDFMYRLRDYDTALQFYREGARKNPAKKAGYQKRMIEALFVANKPDEARQILVDLLKSNPTDDEARAMHAALQLASANKDEVQKATAELQAIVTRMPQNPTVRYNYGRAMAMKGDYQQARIQFEEAIKLRPYYLLPRLGLTEILLRNNEFGRVLQLTQEVFAYDPNNIPARLMRTRALIGAGELKQARVELNVLSQVPNLWEAKYQMGVLEAASGNLKQAETIFREVYEKSKDLRALNGLSDAYLRQGRVDEALKLHQDRIAADPARVENYINAAGIAGRAGKLDLAQQLYGEALKRNDRIADVWARLGEVQFTNGDAQKAVESFNKAREIDPKLVNAWLGLALVHESKGEQQKARAMYEQVLKLQSDNPIALNNLAYQLAESGTDLDQALALAQKAKQKSPTNPNITDTLGWVYIKKNLHDSAIGLYRELIRTNPQNATFQYHLAMALASKGNKPEARKALEAALKNKPARNEEAKIRELMAKLG
ncbi:MAG TPA: tetratricopeptide repeat protein [Bryobacteraceae bacterium]|nr:tetratricopeptide repeat protein [Bryobacteraceae bacterium]